MEATFLACCSAAIDRCLLPGVKRIMVFGWILQPCEQNVTVRAFPPNTSTGAHDTMTVGGS
jgi:hypothetical protein